MPTLKVFCQKQGRIFFHAHHTDSVHHFGVVVFPMGGTRDIYLPKDYVERHYFLVREGEADDDMEGRGVDGRPLLTRDYPRALQEWRTARSSGGRA